MAVTMHQYVCLACEKPFESDKRKAKVCSTFCRGKLMKKKTLRERTCACGTVFTGYGVWCPSCVFTRKHASRRRSRLRYLDRIKADLRAKYAADAEHRQKLRQISVRNRFNGQRDEALKRDDYRCCECGTTEKLVVHHKHRRTERNKKDAASRLEDLQTLCRRCHINVHRQAGDLVQIAN